MSITRAENTEGVDSSNFSIPKPPWEKVDEDSYSADHVIHAYRKGQERGITDHLKAVEKVAQQNVNRLMKIIDDFIKILQDDFSVDFKDARIKVNHFDDFEAIITIEKTTYFSDNLNKIYDRFFEYEKNLNVDFEYQVMFTFEDEHTNYKKMLLDGYNFFRKSS
jgi:DNA-directed RNA polymerase subunit F